jgi:hypothetical protein
MCSRQTVRRAVVWLATAQIACGGSRDGGPAGTPPSLTPVSLAIAPATT